MKVVDRSRLLVLIGLEAKKTCRIHWKKSSRGHSGADDLSGRSDEYMCTSCMDCTYMRSWARHAPANHNSISSFTAPCARDTCTYLNCPQAVIGDTEFHTVREVRCALSLRWRFLHRSCPVLQFVSSSSHPLILPSTVFLSMSNSVTMQFEISNKRNNRCLGYHCIIIQKFMCCVNLVP